MKRTVVTHRDLDVYGRAFDAAMEIYRLSAAFPKEERYALTDQIRRSSRSVCANLAEAWRRRRYEGAFINKLSIAESEAAETQVWLEFAVNCNHLTGDIARPLYEAYNGILRTIVGMINHPDSWTISPKRIHETQAIYDIRNEQNNEPPF